MSTSSAPVDAKGVEDTLKELNLSKEEVNKFEKAFKDPKFIELFTEYAKEVSDPKAKAENDAYLRQIEHQGKVEEVYGKGAQLIIPMEAFVLKTREAKAGGQKVFINVCTSDKVAKYSMQSGKSTSGSSGTHFNIPLSLGPQRIGTDKDGAPCLVYDFTVHPDTASLALHDKRIIDTLAETAMEKIEMVSSLKLDHGYKLPKMKYKKTDGADKPPVLCVRGQSGESVNGRVRPDPSKASSDVGQGEGTHAAGARQAISSAEDDKQRVASSSGIANPSGQGKRSAFAFGQGKPPSEKAASTSAVLTPAQPGYKHSSGEVTPIWELVHRGTPDLAASWKDAGRNLAVDTTMPKELVLRMQLPGVSGAGAVDLDVTRTQVIATVVGKYKLQLNLPYPVDTDKGKAKFDKARSQLEVILPVVPPTAPPPALLQKMEPHEQEEKQQVPLVAGSSDDTSRQRDGTGSWAASSNECGVPQQLQVVPEVQVLNSNSPPTASGQSARDTDSNVSSSGRSEQQLSENERKWLELHSTQLASGAKLAAQHATASEGAVLAGSAAPDLTGPGTIPGQAPQAQAEAQAEGSLTPPLPAVVLRPRLMASAALAEELD